MEKLNEKSGNLCGSTAMTGYAKFGGREYDTDCLNSTFQEAAKLAVELRTFCEDNNIPKDAIICGVAVDGFHIEESAYIRGKKYEKDRIATLLGLGA